MLDININEEEAKKIYLKKLDEYLQKIESETLFWDTEDLMKQTRLSWNTIQKEFFFDDRFPKRRVGRKWLFPVQKTKEFLLIWLDEKRC